MTFFSFDWTGGPFSNKYSGVNDARNLLDLTRGRGVRGCWSWSQTGGFGKPPEQISITVFKISLPSSLLFLSSCHDPLTYPSIHNNTAPPMESKDPAGLEISLVITISSGGQTRSKHSS